MAWRCVPPSPNEGEESCVPRGFSTLIPVFDGCVVHDFVWYFRVFNLTLGIINCHDSPVG